MAQVTALQATATPGRVRTFTAKAGATWTSIGNPILYTAANWNAVTFYFENFTRATTGTACSRLYDETLSSAVASSEVSTTNATFTRLRTAALTLADGSTYRSQFGKSGGDAGETKGAALLGIKT